MSLGYALLHRSRIELALGASGLKRTYDETADIAFGALGAGNLGPGVQEFLNSRGRSLQQWIEGLTGEGGPFAPLRALFGGEPPSMANLPALLERLTTLVDNAGAFKETLGGLLHGFVDRLPDLNGAALTGFLRGQVDDATGILEKPLRDGRRDTGAHRGFRAAVTLRQLLGTALGDLTEAASGLDVKALLHRLVDELIQQLGAADLERVAGAFRNLNGQFGGLLRAFGNLSASGSVSVSGGASGPQGLADEPVTFRDDVKAAPHPPGSDLWVLDLVTNIFATFFSIWETVRTGNFTGRGFDGFLSVLLILVQTVQTIGRSAAPGKVSVSSPDEEDAGQRALNWFFTDQAHLSINLFLRFIGSLHERGAACDWALSMAQRFLKYFTNVVNARIFYWFFRSWGYFNDWKTNGFTGEGAARQRVPVSFNRVLWTVWGPWYVMSALSGLIPSWEDFSLAKGFGKARTLVPLILGGLAGLVLGYVALGSLSGEDPFALKVEPDFGTFVLFALLLILGAITLTIILANIESPQRKLAIGFFVAFAVLILIGLVALGIVFGFEVTDKWNSVAVVWLTIVAGLFVACLLPFVLWWYYIDADRDKLGVFDGRPADDSPYRLPYRQGENWFCGQGVHGLFSHLFIDPSANLSDNHYAYDFNNDQDTPALVARDGIVLNFVDQHKNDGDTANTIEVQHLSWIQHHDPGQPQEGVITRAKYVHLSRERLWVDTGHRLVQGYHLADIDNTGISALNHLHWHVCEHQRNLRFTSGALKPLSYPVVFRDASLRRFRNFPLLAWIGGKGHIDGKPLAFAYYTSDNAEKDPVPNPVRVETSDAGPGPHHHFLELDHRVLGTGELPASLVVTTTVERGHVHQITLTAAELRKILGFQSLDGLTVSTVQGHSHTLKSRGRLGAFLSQPPINIVNPPNARLLALKPAPYKLVGDQLVLRVNDRAIEYFFFGARRATLLADVALDRGLSPTETLNLGGTAYALPALAPGATADTTARGTARLLATQIRTGAGGTPARPVAILCRPVLVLETRRRGRTTRLEVTGASSAPFVAPGHPTVGVGSGVFDDFGAIDTAVLATHITQQLRSGWPAAPAGLAATLVAGQLQLEIGAAPVAFGNSSARLAEVLTRLYDGTTRRLRATGPMPLSSGQIDLGPPANYRLSVLATPARLRLDPTVAAFTGPALTASPLRLTALGVTQSIALAEGDNDSTKLALKIVTRVEGLRAWPEGTAVVVETVAAGPGTALEIRKEAPTVADNLVLNAVGGAPPLAEAGGADASGSLRDTTALSPAELRAVILDAAGRSSLGFDVAAVNPQASIVGDRLVIQVDAAHTVSISRVGFTGPSDPFNFTQAAPNRLESAVLANPLALAGPAWIDFLVAGRRVRVALDGEPARLDLGPLDRLPNSRETLELALPGQPAVEVRFTGRETGLAEIAATLAAASPLLAVRVAYTWSIENALYANLTHTLQLAAAPGLAAAGFLRDPAQLTAPNLGVGDDQVAVPATFPNPVTEDGEVVPAFTFVQEVVGVRRQWKLTARPGFKLLLTGTPTPDVLGFLPPPPPPTTPPTPPVPPTATETITSAPQDLKVAFGTSCQEYRLEVRQGDTANVVATSRWQINASPAIARTSEGATLPFAGGTATLGVKVLEPAAVEADILSFVVDLTGAASLEEVADRVNAAIPCVRAWVVNPPGAPVRPALHVETAGHGTGWELRLDPPPLLVALGFPPAAIDWTANRLQVTGGGNVRDQAAVTAAEIDAALERAKQCTTGLVTSGIVTGPQRLQITVDGADLILRSLEGPVTIETDPITLRAPLSVTGAPDATRLAPGATFALDNGTILVKAAGRTVAVAHVWGDQARVRAELPLPDPASPEGVAMLALLRSDPLRIHVDGTAPNLPRVPASITTFEALVEWLAAQVPQAWIGIVDGHLVLESRDRGSGRRAAIDFSGLAGVATYPAGSVLGFTAGQLTNAAVKAQWQVTGSGRGSVPHLEAVTTLGAADSLEKLLRDAAALGAAPQSAFDVEVDSGAAPPKLRLRANAAAWVLRQAPAPVPPVGPGTLRFAAPPPVAGTPVTHILEANYPGTPAFEPGVFELTAELEPGVRRDVTALFAPQTLGLPGLRLPTNLTVLQGRGFSLELRTGGPMPIVFQAPAGVTAATLAAQIERQSNWKVRARVRAPGPPTLLIETVAVGSAQRLTLSAASGATPNAITGDPATGITVGMPLPLSLSGLGLLPDLGAVEPGHFQAVVRNGYLAERTSRDRSRSPALPLTLSRDAYEVPAPTTPEHFSRQSGRSGCLSAVVPIVLEASALDLTRAFERAPAVHGSVALQAFTNTKSLSGTLSIQFNDNGTIADLPPTTVVPVTFTPGAYTAADVAQRIHAELFGRGVGQAAAYADGTVVIESLVAGLAGSVRIPAPGTGGSGADRTLLEALLGAGASAFGRGWPGVGLDAPGDPVRPGFRSRQGDARAAAKWEFTVPGLATPVAVQVRSGQTLADLQRAVDDALRTGAGRRIGICLIGPDDTLQIEGETGLTLAVNGHPLPVTAATKPGDTANRQEEPAVGLRRTHEMRTFRYARDRFGLGNPAQFDDAGWIRMPANATTGEPSFILTLPPGRYWTAVRSDAAKTRDYDATGEMIASGGLGAGAATPALVHRARYWIEIPNAIPLRIGRTTTGEFLLDLWFP